jgi:hypothetical protein
MNKPNLQNIYTLLTPYSQLPEESYGISVFGSAATPVVYIGSEHIFDPSDTRLAVIESEFARFTNKTEESHRCAVIEGGLRDIAESREKAIIEQGGEGGLLTYLAHQASIDCVCYEPSRGDVITFLDSDYSRDQIFFSQMIDAFYQYYAEKMDNDIVEFIQFFINDFNTECNTDYSINSLHVIAKKLNIHFDYTNSELMSLYTNPTDQRNPIRSVTEAIALCRDLFIVSRIVESYRNDVAQFVVYGGSHLQVQQRALKELII